MSFSRRPFFLLFFYAAFFITGSISSSENETTHLRMMAANISSGNQQSYNNGEGIRIFQGLKPDVVMLQEFNYGNNSANDIRAFVDSTFGENFHYYREGESSDQIPNGIISRYPIIEAGEWEDSDMPNRDFAWARIDIPGDKDLWAISVHLSAKKSQVRALEAAKLVEKICEIIPMQDFVVLGGDFNTQSRNEPPLKILGQIVSESESPVDSEGKSETNMNRNKNYDWLLVNPNLESFLVPVQFVQDQAEVKIENTNQFSHGLVFTSKTFPLLDRVQPIQRGDSTALGMQHLPVVKDFRIPVLKN
ncbi:MAG: endonuclease/exonuclease/phosphatase family protein [Deltaproteobacteria bacterium]|nr:endonuclease/exonuclease/phosphatase family protein [Deltaproteobacteria bacterium]